MKQKFLVFKSGTVITYRLHWTASPWNRVFPAPSAFIYIFLIFISSRLPIAKSLTSKIEAAVKLPLFQNSQCSFAFLWPTAESSWVFQSHLSQGKVGFDSMLHRSCLGTKLLDKTLSQPPRTLLSIDPNPWSYCNNIFWRENLWLWVSFVMRYI